MCARETVDSVPNFYFFVCPILPRSFFLFSLAGHNNVTREYSIASWTSQCLYYFNGCDGAAGPCIQCGCGARASSHLNLRAGCRLTDKKIFPKSEKQTKDKREEEEEEAPHQNDDDDDGVFSSIASN